MCDQAGAGEGRGRAGMPPRLKIYSRAAAERDQARIIMGGHFIKAQLWHCLSSEVYNTGPAQQPGYSDNTDLAPASPQYTL